MSAFPHMLVCSRDVRRGFLSWSLPRAESVGRLLRIMRLVRILQFVNELRTMVPSGGDDFAGLYSFALHFGMILFHNSRL